MHVTLHLTTNCNLNCSYCYAPPSKTKDMSEEVLYKAIEFGSGISPDNTGIIFFGGEPLLRKDLIKTAIDFCNELKRKQNYQHHFKVTTNGMLLDEEFLEYCSDAKLSVALSFDGIKEAHDCHRITPSGKGSFYIIDSKIELLLKYQPYASFLMVVSPETVKYYSASVEYLFGKGVKYIITSLNYAGNWTDKNIKELKKQYMRLAKVYEKKILNQDKFYFSPFEVKFASRINSEYKLCEQCHLGMRQISVSTDGSIYPCVQFVRDKDYSIGNIRDGIDNTKRLNLQKQYSASEECIGCAIADRCNNSCSCLNWQTTGTISNISPVLCETERILTPIVDKLGEKLFRKKSPLFIQKHYNSSYPILSLIEDTIS